MLRSLHMKLVMLMVLLILSLMTVVGAFLINSVVAFYIQDFYSQMSTVFGDQEIVSDLRTAADGETDGAGALKTVLNAYAGQLGVDTRNRNFYILDGEGTSVLASSNGESGASGLSYTGNLMTAIESGQVGDESNAAADYMDVAIPIQRGGSDYIIYILDNKATVSNLNNQLFLLIMEALLFGLVISVLLSFLLSKTMITPIQRLTEGAMRVAEGDFAHKIEVASRDEIGVLTDTFNDMAGQLQDTMPPGGERAQQAGHPLPPHDGRRGGLLPDWRGHPLQSRRGARCSTGPSRGTDDHLRGAVRRPGLSGAGAGGARLPPGGADG